MVIFTSEFYEILNEYELLCESCRKTVGRATRAECSELAAKQVQVLCFDCEGPYADVIPSQLSPKKGEAIFLGKRGREKVVLVQNENGEIAGRSIKLSAPACLSSTSNLHETVKQNGVFETCQKGEGCEKKCQ